MFEELLAKQRELDDKKYYESQIARQDLSGKMEYCKGCSYRYYPFSQCELSHETRVNKTACATNYFNLKNKEKEKSKNDTRKKSSK